ncbi:hypothetical protein WJX84_007541, partial [Apatococcus fuscideae]
LKAGANRPYDVAELPENQPKNRYYDVLPFDYNRVLLHPKDYINASLVKAKDEEIQHGNAWHFIAAQGPLEETAADFWRMIMEQYTKQIVMLTRTEEQNTRGEVVEKCCCYFPVAVGDSQLHGSLTVKLLSIAQPNADLVIRRFSITNAQINDTWEVDHFQFISWPDQGATTKGNGTLLDLIRRLESTGAVEMAKREPPVIHCNTGIGRTGVFIALAVILRRLAQMPPNYTPNGMDIVCMRDVLIELRRQRMGLISNIRQYAMLHEAVRDWLRS